MGLWLGLTSIERDAKMGSTQSDIRTAPQKQRQSDSHGRMRAPAALQSPEATGPNTRKPLAPSRLQEAADALTLSRTALRQESALLEAGTKLLRASLSNSGGAAVLEQSRMWRTRFLGSSSSSDEESPPTSQRPRGSSAGKLRRSPSGNFPKNSGHFAGPQGTRHIISAPLAKESESRLDQDLPQKLLQDSMFAPMGVQSSGTDDPWQHLGKGGKDCAQVAPREPRIAFGEEGQKFREPQLDAKQIPPGVPKSMDGFDDPSVRKPLRVPVIATPRVPRTAATDAETRFDEARPDADAVLTGVSNFESTCTEDPKPGRATLIVEGKGHEGTPGAGPSLPGDAGLLDCLEGDRLFFGLGCAVSMDGAVRCFERAATHGNLQAMVRLATCKLKGLGCPKDDARAVRLLKQAAAGGNADAQHVLAQLFESGEMAGQGLLPDLSRAFQLYKQAAEAGHLAAAVSLGSLLEAGQGTTLDALSALYWYRIAGEAGDAIGQYRLGCLIAEGVPPYLEPDPEAAAGWLRRSSQQGHAPAMHNLAQAAERGHGVKQDAEEAASLYRAAAEAGHAPAHLHIANLLFQSRQYAEAAERYRRAGEAGTLEAWILLGDMHEKGLAGPKDAAAAAACFQRAVGVGTHGESSVSREAHSRLQLLAVQENAQKSLPLPERPPLEKTTASPSTILIQEDSRTCTAPPEDRGDGSTAGHPPDERRQESLDPPRVREWQTENDPACMPHIRGEHVRKSTDVVPNRQQKESADEPSNSKTQEGNIASRAAAFAGGGARTPESGSPGSRLSLPLMLEAVAAKARSGSPQASQMQQDEGPVGGSRAGPARAVAPRSPPQPPRALPSRPSLLGMKAFPSKKEDDVAGGEEGGLIPAQRSAFSVPVLKGPSLARSPLGALPLGTGSTSEGLAMAPRLSFKSMAPARLNIQNTWLPTPSDIDSPGRCMSPESSERIMRAVEKRRRARQSPSIKSVFQSPLGSFKPTSMATMVTALDPAPGGLGNASLSAITVARMSMLSSVKPGALSGKGTSGAYGPSNGLLLDKMTIMGRVQEVSARELVTVKAERDLFQESNRNLAASSEAMAEVMKKLYIRVLRLEQQVRAAGLDPVLPEASCVSHIAGFSVEELDVEELAPTASIHHIFRTGRSEEFDADAFQTYSNPVADPDNTRRPSFVFSESRQGFGRASTSHSARPARTPSPLRGDTPQQLSRTLNPRVGFGQPEAQGVPDRMFATTPSPRPAGPAPFGGKGKKVWDDMELSASGVSAPPRSGASTKKIWDEIEFVSDPAAGIEPRTQTRGAESREQLPLKSSLKARTGQAPMDAYTGSSLGKTVSMMQDGSTSDQDRTDRASTHLGRSGEEAAEGGQGYHQIDVSLWDARASGRREGGETGGKPKGANLKTKSHWRGARGRSVGASTEGEDETPRPVAQATQLHAKANAHSENTAGVTIFPNDTSLTRQGRMKSALKRTVSLLSSTLRPRKI
eukprot:jgi/Botrbrau1/21789/Bobra.0190s0016.2